MRLTDYLRSAPIRIAAIYAVLFLVSVLLIFGTTYWSISREMTTELRDAIEQDMRPLVSAYSEGRLDRVVEAVRERSRAAEPGASYYLLVAPGGQVLAGNLPPLPAFQGWRTLDLTIETDSRSHRDSILALGARLGGAFAFVGRSTDRLEQTQSLILRSLRWAILATVLLSLAGGFLLSRGALRRVEEVNRAVHAIMAGDLSRRLPVGRSDDELNRLAANVNAMLDRIGELMESLRQVTNDIAHDLRTPLGRLRQRLESARSEGPEAAARTLDDAVVAIGEILETFNALLRIAQIEAGARRQSFGEVDLSEVLQTVVELYDALAEEEGMSLVSEIGPGLRVEGDRELLLQLFANLAENAIRHGRPGGEVCLSAAAGPDGVTASVADDGPGIPAEERERVLQRFYRLETARTTPGSGLGLALVKAIADLHGATLGLADHRPEAPCPGLKVSLHFAAR